MSQAAQRDRPTVLFVPQTRRNAGLLAAYAAAIARRYRIVFLRSVLFGENCPPVMGHEIEVAAPSFLCDLEPPSSELGRLWKQLRSHRLLRVWMRRLAPAVVVVGIDDLGMGHWAAHVANELGIPSFTCQEGANWVFRYPFETRVKRFVHSVLTRTFFPAGAIGKEYATARYALVWGPWAKEKAMRNGKSPDRVWVVGHPTASLPAFVANMRPTGKPAALFLDLPTTNLPPGTVDVTAHHQLRTEILKELSSLCSKVLCKPHPFTPTMELELIRQATQQLANVVVVASGVAEDLFAGVDCCVTFPSTTMFALLRAGIPIIQIKAESSGFAPDNWDPVARHNAGVTISSAVELEGAIRTVGDPQWLEQYRMNSVRAAGEVIGPADGKAGERFSEVIMRFCKEWS